MYQGKFSQNNNKTGSRSPAPQAPRAQEPRKPVRSDDVIEGLEDLDELLREPVEQKPSAPQQRQPQRPERPQQRPAAPRPQRPAAPQTAQRPQRPAAPRPQRPDPQAAQKPQQTQRAPQRPASQKVQQPAPQPEKKKKGIGGLVFYTIFFLFIFAFYVFVYFGLHGLQDWLVQYEAAQPTKKYEEIFDMYFADPDWGLLYDNAGIQESQYEGREEFVAYMEQKVGETPLMGLETSAGLDRNTKKYIVRLGDEKIAGFTLVNQNQSAGNPELSNLPDIPDIPDWELGEFQLFFTRNGSYQITLQEGHTATVNGVPLDDSGIVRKVANKAGEYLPEGVAGNQIFTLQIDGLMVQPQVVITDGSGQEMNVTYDEATHTFTEELTADVIGANEEKLALDALKTYAEYMSGKASANDIAKHFDSKSAAYKAITGSDLNWVQSDKGHQFSNEKVTDYVRYNDDLFSVRASLTLGLIRGDGSVKESQIEQSMFFQKNKNGKWLCFAMTAVNVSEPVEEIRLVFTQDGTVLSDEFVPVDAPQVQCPVVSAPQGQVFSGWATQEKKDNGDTVMRLVFQPDEKGIVSLTGGADLKPMELVPVFEAAAPTA